MRAEEMVWGFAVNLAGDFEEGQELHSMKKLESRGIEIDHGRTGREDHVIDLVSQLGREGHEGKGRLRCGGIFIFRGVCRSDRRRLSSCRNTLGT